MKFFVRAVVTGFALSLGSALFKKLASRVGLDDKAPKSDDKINQQDGVSDPGLARDAVLH